MWKNLLKADSPNTTFNQILLEAMEETDWEMIDSQYERMDAFKADLTFFHPPSKVKIIGHIAPNPKLSNLNPYDMMYQGFREMPSVENVKEVLAPTLRSLDWLIEIIQQMSNKVKVEKEIINVTGEYSTYTIYSSRMNGGCYEVESEEGYDICIVDKSEKPMGDIMVSLILALANDEKASEEIEGLEDYLRGGSDEDCDICENSIYVGWGSSEVQCDTCGLTYTVNSVTFQPTVEIEMEPDTIVSPKGNRYSPYQIEYIHNMGDGWWKTDDYLFNYKTDETMNIDSTGEVIYEHHSGIWFGSGDTLLYDEDGDEMPVDEVWDIINNEGDFLDLVYRESNVEPDESEVAELLGYEATTDANYTKDGKYFTFDESDYFQEVEKPEVEKSDMSWKSIIKKNIQPVNMMLKDYFAAVSYGKNYEVIPLGNQYNDEAMSVMFVNKNEQNIVGRIDVSGISGINNIAAYRDGARQQHISDGLTYDKSNHSTSRNLNRMTYSQLYRLLSPSFRSLEFLESFMNSTKNAIWSGGSIRITGDSGKAYEVLTNHPNNDGCYPVSTEEGYNICIVSNSNLPLGDNLMTLVGALANDTSKGSQDIDGLREYVYGVVEDRCNICYDMLIINLEDVKVGENEACHNCGFLWTLEDVSFEPSAMISVSESESWSSKLPTNSLIEYDKLDVHELENAHFDPKDDPRIGQFGDDSIFCFYESKKKPGSKGIPVLIFSLKQNKILYDDDYIPNRKGGPERYEEDIAILLANGELHDLDERYMRKNYFSKGRKSLSSSSNVAYNMKWSDYLKKSSSEDVIDWETALKSFISEGKKLGIPLSVMDILKLAKEVTTSQSEGFETLHKPTFGEEEEEDD